MYTTKNDLPEQVRVQAVELLNARLADVTDLQTQLKQGALERERSRLHCAHELFDNIHEDVEKYTDLIAERAVQLDRVAVGTVRAVARTSLLKEYPANFASGREHVAAVASALSAFGKLARQAIEQSADLRDADSSDLFTEVSRGVDKWLWFVEAHLQAEH